MQSSRRLLKFAIGFGISKYELVLWLLFITIRFNFNPSNNKKPSKEAIKVIKSIRSLCLTSERELAEAFYWQNFYEKLDRKTRSKK